MTDEYRIEYLPVAKQDLIDIFEYIRADNPNAALKLIAKVDETISRLATVPYLGPVPKDDRLRLLGYRMLVIDHYLVFYVVLDEVVEIQRILHGRRKYGFLL